MQEPIAILPNGRHVTLTKTQAKIAGFCKSYGRDRYCAERGVIFPHGGKPRRSGGREYDAVRSLVEKGVATVVSLHGSNGRVEVDAGGRRYMSASISVKFVEGVRFEHVPVIR